MTVHTTTNRAQFTGNGSTRVWHYTFPCVDEDWLKLYLTSNGTTSQVLNDYAVDLDEKTVTYPVNGAALTSAQKLTILREVPLEQTLDLVNQGTLEAESIEAELDEIVQMAQQLEEKLSRCVMAGVDETSPSVDYDALQGAAVLAQTMGTRAQAAAASAEAAALAAQTAANAATTAKNNAVTATQNANAAALAAQSAADAVDDYTARAEAAAAAAEADAIKAYSNAQKAHQYFCAVWGVVYPFLRWFMVIPIVDGKCSLVFTRKNPGIYDGSDSAVFDIEPATLRAIDGMHSDPMDWWVINPIVTEFLEAVPQIRSLLSASDAAQHALELTINAANAVVAQAEAAIGQADDYIGQMDELVTATGEIASQACSCSRKSCRAATRAATSEENVSAALTEIRGVTDDIDVLMAVLTGGEPGQVLTRTATGYEWVTLP